MSKIAELKQKARSLEQREQWKSAIEVYDQIVRDSEGEELEVGFWNRVGDLHMRLSQTQQAVVAYERAVDAYSEAGLHNNALALCNKILRVSPGRTPIFLKLGLISAAKGFAADARHYLGGFVDQMAAAGNEEAAIATLIRHADAQPDDEANVRSMVAEQIRARGHDAEAVRLFQGALRILRDRGQHEEGDRIWDVIREMQPGAAAPSAPRVAPPAAPSAHAEVPLLDFDIRTDEPAAAEAGIVIRDDSAPAADDDHGDGLEEITLLSGFETRTEAEELDGATGSLLDDDLHADRHAEGIEADGVSLLDDLDVGFVDLDDLDDDTSDEQSDALPLITFDDASSAYVAPLDGLDAGFIGTDEDEDEDDGADDPSIPLLSNDELPFLGTDDSAWLMVPDADPADDETEDAGPDLGFADVGAHADAAEEDHSLPFLSTPFATEAEAGADPHFDVEAEAGEADDAFPWLAPGPDAGVEEREADAAGEEDVAEQALLTPTAPELEVEAEPVDPAVALRARLAADPRDRDAIEALLDRMRAGDGDAASADALDDAVTALAAAGDVRAALAIVRSRIEIAPAETSLFQRQVELASRADDASLQVEAYLALAEHLRGDGDEAKVNAVFERVLEIDPDNRAARAALGFPEFSAPLPSDDGYIDLAALIFEDEPTTGSTRFVVEADEPSGDEDHDFAEILARFREQVAQNIDADDAASHYDLGVAFKEMGLLEEAISEFQIALRAGSHPLATLEMLGECFVGQGQHAVAWRVLERAIRLAGAPDAEMIGVLYWMGRCDEALDRRDAAVACYERVLSVEIGFRDASERLRELRAMVPRGAF